MIVDFDVQLSGFVKAPPGAPPGTAALNSHLKHVMEKRNGAWKVLSAQNTPSRSELNPLTGQMSLANLAAHDPSKSLLRLKSGLYALTDQQ
jgi:hypothetical protein